MSAPSEIPFKELLDALLDTSTPFHPRYLYRLSDIGTAELTQLEEKWFNVPLRRRQALIEDLEDLGDRDYTLSFVDVCRLAIVDEDPIVRLLGIRILSEYEDSRLLPLFLDIVANDENPDVRAASATALGSFVYLGELDKLPGETLIKVEECLLRIIRGKDSTLIQRRALESLGYSSKDKIVSLIENAYSSGDMDWLASSIFAMGRSANSEWAPRILTLLDHPRAIIRAEAARAAGKLEITDTVPKLLELLEDSDSDVRSAAIWSLSQIGGEGVRDALEDLFEYTQDDEEADIIEIALDNLTFTEDMQQFSLIDYPERFNENEVYVITPEDDSQDNNIIEDEDIPD
jgi:HEAT repeat protein